MAFKSIQVKVNDGAALDATKGGTASAGDKLRFRFDVEADSVIHAYVNNSTLKNRRIGGDWQGPAFEIDWTVDVADGSYNLVFEQRRRDVTVDRRQIGFKVVKRVTAGDPNPTAPGESPSGPPKEVLTPIAFGMVLNDNDDPEAVTAAIKNLAAAGGKFVRFWHSHFNAFSKRLLAMIDEARAAGLLVIVCVQPKDNKPEDFGTPDFPKFFKLNAAPLARVEFLEAGNELNLNQYRPDDFGNAAQWPKAYVERWIKPMRVALDAAKLTVKVLCTSITDTYDRTAYASNGKALAEAGAAKYCDGLALHLYAYLDSGPTPNCLTIGNLPDVVRAYSDTLGGKPVVVTEAALHDKAVKPIDLPTKLDDYVVALRRAGRVIAALMYRGVPHSTLKAWNAARTLFDNEGEPTPNLAAVKKAVAA